MKKLFTSTLFSPFFLSAAFLAVLLISTAVFFFFHKDSTANIFDENIETSFLIALEKNDTDYFSELLAMKIDEENTESNNEKLEIQQILTEIYEHKIDIEVLQKNNFIFFSFFGIKPNSTVLHSVYGNWNTETETLSVFDEMPISIMQKKEEGDIHEIVFTNSSKFAFPIDGELLLLPYEKEGSSFFSKKLVLPGDSFSFVSDYFIPEKVSMLESLKYGFSLSVR